MKQILCCLLASSTLACRSFFSDDSLLTQHQQAKERQLDLSAMSLDVGRAGESLSRLNTTQLAQVAAIVSSAQPDLVGIMRFNPEGLKELLQLLPRYKSAPLDPIAAAAQAHPLLLYRGDRFEFDPNKSGKHYRSALAKAQHVVEKSSGKALFVGQLAWYPSAAPSPNEVLKLQEIFGHVQQHRAPSDMLMMMGHWPLDAKKEVMKPWLDVFKERYGENVLNPRLKPGAQREDFILCEKGACEVEAAEIVHIGEPAAYAFEAWPLLSRMRLSAERPNPTWRLASDALAIP